LIKANGFVNVSNKQTVLNGLLYYNPNDKRAIVEKQFGVGTTINLASKQGRLIIYILLSIPLFVIFMILFAFKIAGKI